MKRVKKFVPTESQLEKQVGKILRKLGYKFRKQVAMYSTRKKCRGVFDFFLDAHDVAIEVNGTYWHSDPRAYPDGPVYKTQRRNARSWKKKMRYAKDRGIDVLVLWELDLTAAEDMYVYVRDTIRSYLKDRKK